MSLEKEIRTLRDDIAWYASGSDIPLFAIAAGLERDYYLVKLADLPEVTERAFDYRVDEKNIRKIEVTRDEVERGIRRLVALDQYLESRESEAAALQARRDKLTAELTGIDGERYNSIGVGTTLRKSIDRIIELEAQVSS